MSIVSTNNVNYDIYSPPQVKKVKFNYSFPRSVRFPKTFTYCQQAHYRNSSQLDKKGIRIGTGPRSDFTKTQSVAPAPTVYCFATKFDKNIEKNKGYTFGISRELIKESNYINPSILTYPGVGQYQQSEQLSKISFTMRPKTPNKWLPNFLYSQNRRGLQSAQYNSQENDNQLFSTTFQDRNSRRSTSQGRSRRQNPMINQTQ